MPKSNTSMTAGELAKKLDVKIFGNPDVVIDKCASIVDAKSGSISFYSREKNSENFKILPIDVLKNTKASVIVLDEADKKYAPKSATLLFAKSPRSIFGKILSIFYADPKKYGIHKSATIARGVVFQDKKSVYIGPNVVIEMGAVIAPNVSIEANSYIDRFVSIGENTKIHSNVSISNAIIGKNCVIYPGARIGQSGFGYTVQNGRNEPIQHLGKVILNDFVDVGANACIDRGALDDTIIGEGTKLDNMVHIAHGVKMGKHGFVAGETVLAGGVVVGDYVFIGGNSSISNKVKIADNAKVAGHTGVMKDVESGDMVVGFPARASGEFFREIVLLKKMVKNGEKK